MKYKHPINLNSPTSVVVRHILYSGAIIEVNDAMQRMYNSTKEKDLIGLRLVDFFSVRRKGDLRVVYSKILAFINNGYIVEDSIAQEKDINENVIYISNSTIGLVENNHLNELWGVQRNVTNTIMLQKELERKVQTLEKFTHLVSHDLRRPVCSILGLTQLNTEKQSLDYETITHMNNALNELDDITKAAMKVLIDEE